MSITLPIISLVLNHGVATQALSLFEAHANRVLNTSQSA